MLDAVVVGNVIQRLREEKGVSQEVLSGFADIGRTHLSAIERETQTNLRDFFRICDALEMRPSVVMAAIEKELENSTL